MNSLSVFQSNNARPDKFEGMRSGWTVKVFQKIKEGEKTRVQAFEGMIISRKHNKEGGATVTVRKVSGGIGVEKTFPIYLPTVDKVEVIKKSKGQKGKALLFERKIGPRNKEKNEGSDRKSGFLNRGGNILNKTPGTVVFTTMVGTWILHLPISN